MFNIILLWSVPGFFGKLYSEIHPKYYLEMQRDASDFVKIKVIDVKTSSSDKAHSQNVSVNAEVVEVFRSKNSLTVGQKILIEYVLFKPPPGWVGPRPLPLLQKNKVYDFFGHLANVTGNTEDNKKTASGEKILRMMPAARGYSFQKLNE